MDRGMGITDADTVTAATGITAGKPTGAVIIVGINQDLRRGGCVSRDAAKILIAVSGSAAQILF
jgi:hypothetical protein